MSAPKPLGYYISAPTQAELKAMRDAPVSDDPVPTWLPAVKHLLADAACAIALGAVLGILLAWRG